MNYLPLSFILIFFIIIHDISLYTFKIIFTTLEGILVEHEKPLRP